MPNVPSIHLSGAGYRGDTPGSEGMGSEREEGRTWFVVLLVFMMVTGPMVSLAVQPVRADGDGDYPAPTEGDWIITQETIVNDETIVLKGNLTITSGASLFISNVSIVFDCSYDGEFGVVIQGGGQLQALGFKDFTKGARIPGDFDMVMGSDGGQIRYYRNDGTVSVPDWQDPVNLKDVNGDDVNAGSRSAPFLADLDNDGDLDLIIGERRDNGQVNYYENTGTVTEPEWTRDDSMFSGVTGDDHSKPTLGDLDNDGDLDLVVGEGDGEIFYFENTGTPEVATWSSRSNMADDGSGNIDLGTRCWPALVDLDNDGDLDMPVGRSGNGALVYYKNVGSPESFAWTRDDSVFSGVTAGQYNPAPGFADLDDDGDFDVAIGSYQSGMFYYENTGTVSSPEWTKNDDMFSGVSNEYRMQPSFGDLDGDGPGFIPGEPIWNSEFNTTDEYTFTFVVETGATLEMEQTRVLKCGNDEPDQPGMTIKSNDVSIVNSMFDWNDNGILLDGVADVVIRDTTFENNSVGLLIGGGSGISVINCTFSYNDRGLVPSATEDLYLRDSRFLRCGVLIEGTDPAHFDSHDIGNTTVNGDLLYYYSNEDGITVPTGAGGVIIAGSQNMVLEGLDLYRGDVGIQLAYSDDSLILDTMIDRCEIGIYLYASDRTTVTYTTITDGDVGLLAEGSSADTSVHFNSIMGNAIAGAVATENGGIQVDAARTFWGDITGPYHADDNPAGIGDMVTDDVLFEPWLLAPHGENEWYVDTSAPAGGNGAPFTPFNLIQDGLDMASRGEDVFVLPGTYTESLIIDRPISLFGVDGEVILDAGGLDAVTIGSSAIGATIGNISITNGATDLQIGADTFLFNSSFDSGKVTFIGDALLSVGYYLDVLIVDVDDRPVAGAMLSMTDVRSDTMKFITDENGRLDDLTIFDYLRDSSETIQLNQYQLSAFDFETGYSFTTLDLHSDMSIILNLTRYGSFGSSVATGDLNGDGIEDIAVGAPTDDQNGEDTGAVFIFFGPPGSEKVIRPIDADLVIHGDGEGTMFGSTLAVADVNDDDVDELIVGAAHYVRTLTGITGMYYQNADFTDLEFTRIDATVDFPWNNQEPDGLGDAFSVRWYGKLLVEDEDDYNFFAEIDDVMHLYIDGTRIIERNSYSAEEASSDPIHLEPGLHDIGISYQETGGGARAIVKWSSSTIQKEIIPTEHLYSNIDEGDPDGGVFVFDGDLFDQGPAAEVNMSHGSLLSSMGEELGATLSIADIDSNGYPDILAGSSQGTEIFYGQNDLGAEFDRSTLYGIEQPVMVDHEGEQALAAILNGEIVLLPMAPGTFSLQSFTTADDFQGSFNFTSFNDGLSIYAYRFIGIVENGDFNSAWDNWTQMDSIREKNDGTWELTMAERGDWHVFDGGPTAGLGPDRDEVTSQNNQGRPNDGKLVSDPFVVPEQVDFIDLWHHAKWWSFEAAGGGQGGTPDFISIRLELVSDGTRVAGVDYGAQWTTTNGEEEGRLTFDVSDYHGETLRLVMEQSGSRADRDDGLVQIDNVTGLETIPDASGDFTSDPIELGFSLGSFVAHGEQELNNGTIDLFYRTNESDEWTPLDMDTIIELPGNEDTAFQYRVEFDSTPGDSYPVLSELHFNFFDTIAETFDSGTPFNGGAIFGNATLAKVDGSSAIMYDNSTEAITITSDHPIDTLASYLDIDKNGVTDIIISSNDVVYLLAMDNEYGTMDLKDTPYTFEGGEGFGTVLHGNLVGSPAEHRGDGRVYLLPTGLNDTAIHGVDIEDGSRIHPDTTLSLGLTLQNKGLFDMNSVEVTMDITDDDSYSYQDSQIISISSWESMIVTFDWDVPAVEGAAYHLDFSLSDDDENGNNEYSIDLDAHYHELAISTPKDYDSISPGEVLAYRIEVTDLGTFGTDDITFETDLPGGWEWWVKYRLINVTHVVVDGSVQFDLFVRPDTSVLGEYPFEFRAVSENGVTKAIQPLTAHIVLSDLIPVGVELLRADGQAAKLVAGDDTTMILEVRNDGTQNSGVFNIALEDEGNHISDETGPGIAGEANVMVTFVYQFTEGIHNLTFDLDTMDDVKEYNEANNLFMVQILVWPGTASTPFIFRIHVVDQDGKNVTEANVTATSDEFGIEDITDASGNSNLTLENPYSEGKLYTIEAFFQNLYGSAKVRVYSEDASVSITIMVGRYSFELRPGERDKYILPEGKQSFYFNITNTGVFNDSFSLILTDLPEEWGAELTGEGITDDVLDLETGGSASFTLTITSWLYAPAYERYEMFLGVSSLGSPHTNEEIKLRLAVRLVENITLYSEYFQEHGLPRDPISHRILVNNTGNAERTINLFVTGDTEYSSLNKPEITLGPGDQSEVLLVIIIPNLRQGTVLQHQLMGVVSGIGTTPSLNFTTLIDPTATGYYEVAVEGDELLITNTGNHMDHITVTATSLSANITVEPQELDIDLEETLRVKLNLTMTDMGIPAGSLVPVFISLFNGDRYFINGTRYVTVPPMDDFSFTVDSTTVSVIPGALVEIPILVENIGNVDTQVFFSGTNSGPEPLIIPSPVELLRNRDDTVYLRIQLPGDIDTPRTIVFIGSAGPTDKILELTLDPTVNRGIRLDKISARTIDDGTRYTINLYNTGDVLERVVITATCGELDLLQAEVDPDEYKQFHLLIPTELHCSQMISVNATTLYGSPISNILELDGPPMVDVNITNGMPGWYGEPVIFRASGSYKSYSWLINDRVVLGREVWYNFTRPGIYRIVLTVKDGQDLSSLFFSEVTIINHPPIIDIEKNIFGEEGKTISFDARASYDPDGLLENFTWTIEGKIRQGPNIFYTFSEPGIYSVTLQVTDDLGASNETTLTVTVREDPRSTVVDEQDNPEINMLIVGLSLLLIVIIGLFLFYTYHNLEFEESFMIKKLTDLENSKGMDQQDPDGSGGTGPNAGRPPVPDPEPVTKEVDE